MILGLNTSTPTCAMFLMNETWRDYGWEAGRNLADELLGRIERAITSEGGKSLENLSGIIVYKGPGSYTGLRIGLTVANTLAQSLQLPIVGVTGEAWLEDGYRQLQQAHNDGIVMPVYGGQPNITTPRK